MMKRPTTEAWWLRPGTRTWKDWLLLVLGGSIMLFALGILLLFLILTFSQALDRLSLDFLLTYPSRNPEHAGILPALLGSLWLVTLTLLISVPLGIAAGIYLEEFARIPWLSRWLEFMVFNQGGIPSVVMGLLALEVFVRWLGWGPSLLAGAMALSLLVVPVVIVATREALRSVPQTIREAALSLGATRWQAVWHQVLPAASGGILTGVLLALARALGEAAPLLVVGAAGFISYLPEGPLSRFSALPVQIYNWVARPQKEFWINAAAGIIVLLGMVFFLVAIAYVLRIRWQKRNQW